ncbi:vitamin K epoxide reductase family protein [Fuerstiella marisgermanici]|uniref:VKOR family protein n=1 Tax=Fuerstiella marisgermanici TaxID=1891926 RepID=A0A1P8WCQ2_9PLAN|nr:vitamin K epoxide reductase family protein [Fuerstiella marisgermanici]APZ91840.1 VKOR family protein [Fuerstiella marisgermanici]
MTTFFHAPVSQAPSPWFSGAERPRSSQRLGTESSGSGVHSDVAMGRNTVWMLRIAALAAMVVSAYLGWVTATSGSVAGCGSNGVFDCSHVMTSRWSKVLGLPVSVPSLLLYTLVLTLLSVPRHVSKRVDGLRWPAITFAAFSAGLAAVWFIGLQLFSVEHLCPYCLAVHTCGLLLAAVMVVKRPAGQKMTYISAAAGMVAVGALVTTQLLTPPPEKFEIIEYNSPAVIPPSSSDADAIQQQTPELFEAPISQTQETESVTDLQLAVLSLISPAQYLTSQVTVPGEQKSASPEKPKASNKTELRTATILNDVQLDISKWPLIGSPDAEFVFVEMLDYTCPHCRQTHATVHAALKQYNKRIGVIVLPVPLNTACNPHVQTTAAIHNDACKLAHLAIAVWHLQPGKFDAFHHWLMTTPVNYPAAFAKASTLVGQDELKKELNTDIPAAYIAKNMKLYERARKGVIPKLLFPSSSIVGAVTTPERLIEIIKQQFPM